MSTGMAFAECFVPVSVLRHDVKSKHTGEVIKAEESPMNKWIPISLFLFLGIYLLTTAQAADLTAPALPEAASQSAGPVNLVVVLPP